MGAWKAAAGQVDQEQERIDRQKAAFGAETLSRIKDINGKPPPHPVLTRNICHQYL
jgi:hypothetical protein